MSFPEHVDTALNWSELVKRRVTDWHEQMKNAVHGPFETLWLRASASNYVYISVTSGEGCDKSVKRRGLFSTKIIQIKLPVAVVIIFETHTHIQNHYKCQYPYNLLVLPKV